MLYEVITDLNGNRHDAHMGKTAYVTACNECHGHDGSLAAAGHVDGGAITVSGSKILGYTGPGCVNSCHEVNVATSGDWTDGNDLACLECHSSTYIGGDNAAKSFNATPASGLHAVPPSVTGVQHDDSFGTGGTCTSSYNFV